ncbi:MAG: c-type cytochrome [Kiloniellales bacterium]
MRGRPIAGALLGSIVAAALLVGAPARAEGNLDSGKRLFAKCQACHSLEPGKIVIGPSLSGVIGRTAGTLEGFNYSGAMRAYGQGGVTWTETTLDAFLVAPRQVVKGTRMTFVGFASAQDRADVIAYLKQAAQ